MYRMKRKIVLCAFSIFVLCFWMNTMFKFVMFLSSFTHLKYFALISFNQTLNTTVVVEDGKALNPLLYDMGLLLLFVTQHSLQANSRVKQLLNYIGLSVAERLFYNTGTCVALQILMFNWKPMPSMTLWNLETQNNKILWCAFSLVHISCWLIMYGIAWIMDFPEFLGMKQVYYHLYDWPPPELYKAISLKRLYSHIRHVNFTLLTVIVLIHPVMCLDRLLLAYVFILYMILRFKVDNADYQYQENMYWLKFTYIKTVLAGRTPGEH